MGSSPTANSPLERRLGAEWDLLHRLASRNPLRLTALAADDLTFTLSLHGTPALPLQPDDTLLRSDHDIRIIFPRFFPAAPLELYLTRPVQHPNIHPLTGFVCLWDQHRVSHTVEHALHKLVAILGWRLYNKETVHVMQPDVLARMQAEGDAVAASLTAPLLLGILPEAGAIALADAEAQTRATRRRLS